MGALRKYRGMNDLICPVRSESGPGTALVTDDISQYKKVPYIEANAASA